MQDLSTQQIDQSIHDAVEKHIPLSISIQPDGWVNLHSRFIATQDEHVLVELPVLPDGTPHEFVPAEKIGISYKLKHHKYLGSVRVAGVAQYRLEEGTVIPTLALCFPMHMQRLQRRSFARVAVPDGRIVRVSFWPGGRENEPTGPSETPVWSGKVMDLSAGGFQAKLNTDQPPALDIGDTVGVRIAFGPGESSIYSDAQFRHITSGQDDGEPCVGFQFVGLVHSENGWATLKVISDKMNEFSRGQGRVFRRHERLQTR
jgi:hypothetical protein